MALDSVCCIELKGGRAPLSPKVTKVSNIKREYNFILPKTVDIIKPDILWCKI